MTISTSVERRRLLARRALLSLSTILCSGVGLAPITSASAQQAVQTLSPPDPYSVNITTMNSINPVTGALYLESNDIEVGSAENGSLLSLRRTITAQDGRLTPSVFGGGEQSNLHNYMGWSGAIDLHGCCNADFNQSIKASVNGTLYVFGASGSAGSYSFVDIYGRGSRLSIVDQSTSTQTFKLTDHDGTVYTFVFSPQYIVDAYVTNQLPTYWVSTIDRPSGVRLTFTYEPGRSVTGQTTAARLKSVSNSLGYGLKFSYRNPAIGGSFDMAKLVISQIDAVSASCDLSTDGCGFSTLKSVYYGYTQMGPEFSSGSSSEQSNAYYLTSFTDAGGVVHTYNFGKFYTGQNTYPDLSVLSGSFYTDNGQDELEIPVVYSLTNASGATTSISYDMEYNSLTAHRDNLTTITDPANGVMIFHNQYGPNYIAPVVNEPLVDWVKDPNGNVTSYAYDDHARLVSVTHPEGGVQGQTLDDRGNAVESRAKAKPGSGLADVVVSRSFSDCSEATTKICNQPSSVVDPRLGATDYTYDPAHGGVLTEQQPPDSSGNRPDTTYTYTSFTGVDGVTFYKPSSKTVARDGGQSTFTTYAYDPTNHWVNNQTSVSDGSSTRVSCTTYDADGQLIAKTEPNSGVQVCQ